MAGVPAQRVVWNGREVTIRWRPPPFDPPPGAVTQAYGMCFTAEGLIVVIRSGEHPPYWNLPGGTLEAGETAVEALVREVAEEACARVLRSRYLGCQEIIGDRPVRHYQTRFWARVELDAWEPRFETVERRLVRPEDFVGALGWGAAPTAPELLRLAARVEASDHLPPSIR